ncbi:hypothetical protein Tco_0361346 [Tanacetum coccineum]
MITRPFPRPSILSSMCSMQSRESLSRAEVEEMIVSTYVLGNSPRKRDIVRKVGGKSILNIGSRWVGRRHHSVNNPAVCSESSYFSDENSSIDDLILENEYDKLCKMSLKIITKNKRLKATRDSLEKEISTLKEKVSTLEKNKDVDLECVKCHMLKIENEKLKEEALKLTKFEKSTHCLNEMLNNQKPFGEKLGLWFNSFEASSSGTKEIKFTKAQKKVSTDGGPINMGDPLNVQAAPKVNMGPPPGTTPGSEKAILSGADNRPPFLEKDMYDSWKSIMELYMMNRQHGRMIIESVENGPLIGPTIEENGVTRPRKYSELTPAYERECKLYDEFDKFAYKKGETLRDFYLRFSLLLNDMNIYNVKLEQFQVNTKFLNTLPPEWSKFMTDVKLVRDLHTTNIDQLHAYLGQHEFHANEVRLMHERNSDPLALVATH